MPFPLPFCRCSLPRLKSNPRNLECALKNKLYSEPMATPLSSPFPLLFLARFSASAVALLVIIWALHFKASFIPQSPSQEQHIYAVRENPFFFLHSWFLLNAMYMHVSEGGS